ncbi:MAG: alpha/beta hydrolase [Fimbriimonadaceae bacterium]
MNNSTKLIFLLIVLGLLGCLVFSRGFARSQTVGAPKSQVYKSVGGARLTLNIYEDPKSEGNKPRPAIVFFSGGGWSTGSTKQFEGHARYFASRGMVAITADYRVRSRHQSQIKDSVSDARSAIRWVRANAKRLGVDPNKIASAGGSAGGHLAACTATISEFDTPGEDKSVSAVPNALVLFNPALVLASLPGFDIKSVRAAPNEAFLGAEASKLSPAHHIKPGAPPTIIFHGHGDTTIPFQTAQIFADRMKASGNQCNLIGFADQDHAFFNKEPFVKRTLVSADEFLEALGWLKGPPTLNVIK